MALIQGDFYSTALAKLTNYYLVLPNDVFPGMIEGNKHYSRNMKTLYLLHGYSGSARDWLLGSRAQELAIQYNLAIAMPTGDNSFYLDRKGTGRAYCQHVGKEFIDYTRKTFGLSDRREDTYIGGNSMGGFGAIHTGLAFPETFQSILALSSALIIHDIKNQPEGFTNGMADYEYYSTVFGDLKQLEHSENNPEQLVRRRKEEGKEIPAIFMACGTEDFLLEQNRSFHTFLKEEQALVTYQEGPGVHDWSFWNEYLEKGIEWFLKAEK